MTQRSCDFGLGVPFNIASYALLTHIVAQEVGLKPGILSIVFVDAHVYCADPDDKKEVGGAPRCDYDHTRVLKEQLKREPLWLPRIRIADKPMEQLKFEDIELIDYRSHGLLRMKVAV